MNISRNNPYSFRIKTISLSLSRRKHLRTSHHSFRIRPIGIAAASICYKRITIYIAMLAKGIRGNGCGGSQAMPLPSTSSSIRINALFPIMSVCRQFSNKTRRRKYAAYICIPIQCKGIMQIMIGVDLARLLNRSYSLSFIKIVIVLYVNCRVGELRDLTNVNSANVYTVYGRLQQQQWALSGVRQPFFSRGAKSTMCRYQ